ncbi:MAG TPA: tannase/feruloyl esterase family alpha/beta hydrolase [Ramlibacter sp.]|jgi:feruloyl esterase|nr:tannase/feruloyl esterase family alpha/beta hydrolase [Ramlibacter sp.]
MRTKLTALAAILLLSACATERPAQTTACEDLTRVTAEASTIASAVSVTSATSIGNTAVDARFCRVQGVARPTPASEIKFEVWLPAASAWTGRFKLNGTGGYAGAVPYARLAQDIGDGFITAGSNMGHDGGESAAWTLNQPEKVRDWGLRAHYYVATAAKALAAAHYGKPVRHSYFEGCSNGGRQAMMMAQRFPELFDGIAAGAPSQFYPEILMWLAYSGKVLTPVQGQPSVLPPAKLQFLSRASHAACDAQDGLADGQITNPRVCGFKPDALRCTAGDGPDCLTDPQLAAARAMYAGMRTSQGVQRYAGVMPGSEGVWDPLFADNGRYGPFIGHYVYSRTSPPYDWRRDLNWDDQFDHIKQLITPITAAPSPDLTAFKARGGKLIQFHGWNDPVVTPQGSPAYYNALIQFEKLKNLPRAQFDAAVSNLTGAQVTADSLALASTVRGYHRLFMLPDVGHCRGGTGPEAIGGGFTEPAKAQRTAESHVINALARWVEEGRAPEQIVATKYNEAGAITRQRPICAYPQVAVYRGSGDVNAASSFTCATASADQLPTDAADLLILRNSLRQRDVLGPRR